MRLADEGTHHVAVLASEFIDSLAEDFGKDAELTGIVLMAEVTEGETETVRATHDTTWPHALGIAVIGGDGLREVDG